MTTFDDKKFKKQKYSREQIINLFSNSERDLSVANKYNDPVVIFKFTYDAVLKASIALFAFYGYRIRPIKGHHIEIFLQLKGILSKSYSTTVDAFEDMRRQRNKDLYFGGIPISKTEASEYLKDANTIVSLIREMIEIK